jgi:hypothetical protein
VRRGVIRPPPGGAAKAAKAATARSAVAESFAADTTARIGLSPRTIREYTQVTSMAQDVRDLPPLVRLKNKVKELVAVARLPVPEQKSVADVLRQGGAKNVRGGGRACPDRGDRRPLRP